MRNAVETANRWYRQNGMLANESKYQALILGKSEYTFSFPTKESIDILGMNIDNNLNFHKYISLICKKINNQFNVMLKFRNLISKETLVKLYKAHILPHFDYCSTVWHFCSANNRDKIEALNPLRPNSDVSQTSHCNIKGVTVSEVMRIENMITQVQCY